MATLDRPRVEQYTPADLVRDTVRGHLRIPPFQRGFRWDAADVLKLFDSLLHGFPIGNLLLWIRPAPEQHLQVGPLEIDAPEVASALWVVDGQQRITSIVGALVKADEATDPRFRVHLDVNSGEFRSAGLRQQPPVSWVPVNVLVDTARWLRWTRANASWISDEQIILAEQAAKAIREYQIPTYLVSSAEETPLLEIFTRMNTTGKPLTKSEVFHALHSGMRGDDPADLHSLARVPAERGFGTLEDGQALRCVLAFRGGDIFREDFHNEFVSEQDKTDTFREVATILREVVDFLRGSAGVPHAKLLPYSYVVPVLVRFFRLHNVPFGRPATLMRRWIWRSAVSGALARGISVVNVRNQILALDRANPLDAAQSLLRQVPRMSDFTADLEKVNLNHAMTKINILGLLSAEPLDLTSHQPIDVARLLEKGSPLRTIITDRRSTYARTIANRMVASTSPSRLVGQALAHAAPEVAASHLVDGEAQELLLNGRLEEFLARRAEAVTEVIYRYVDSMAEWGARDGRSVADIIRSAA